ncbi:MAG: four helix bundle protein [Ignavibacteriae bacterium]|nr:four helix bundle protein [Ignavibacteriota bacterium]
MKIKRFEDIESWKLARTLVKDVYSLTSKEPIVKDYGLKDQLRRASVSIMSNISEGFDSGSNRSFIQFVNYSYRSASEVQSLLYVCKDLHYIKNEKFNKMYETISTIKKLIGGFIQFLRSNTK